MSANTNGAPTLHMHPTMILYAHVGDNELVQRICAGETDLAEVLMRRHTPALLRTGRMFGAMGVQLERIAAQTHREAIAALATFDGTRGYRSWITARMIDACAGAVEAEAADMSNGQKAAPQISPVAAEVDSLPDSERSVLLLREVEGFSEQETATLLRIPQLCVQAKHRRAVAQLGKSLHRRIQYSDVYPVPADAAERVVRRVLSAAA